jgi:integration host factor subunit beta
MSQASGGQPRQADSHDGKSVMTKADLINIVARELKITQVQAGIVVEAALNSIINALRSGHEVEIRGFGSFRFRNRAPRKGRNPKTGEKVDVPSKKIPYFKMGKELKALLNQLAETQAETSPGVGGGTE